MRPHFEKKILRTDFYQNNAPGNTVEPVAQANLAEPVAPANLAETVAPENLAGPVAPANLAAFDSVVEQNKMLEKLNFLITLSVEILSVKSDEKIA